MTSTQASYDAVAHEYAQRFFGELSYKPLDRALLTYFAEIVKPLDGGLVCDVGCGPGQIAHYLYLQGVKVVGLDISGEIIAEAQRLTPMLDFRQGDMRSLPYGENGLAGMTAFYCIVHIPRDELTPLLAEWARTLRPGGYLMLAFHAGEETRHLEEWWEKSVNLDFYSYPIAEVTSALLATGFSIVSCTERSAYPQEVQTRRGYIVAQWGRSDG